MDPRIGIYNIEHFADQLGTTADPTKRATLMRLLVEEEDKLGAGLEQLGVTERRIERGHRLIAEQRALIKRMDGNGHDTRTASELLGAMVGMQAAFEDYRRTIMRALALSLR